MEHTEEFQFNKNAFNKCKLGKEPNSRDYWLTRSVEERIDAIEYLREQYHSEDEIKQRLQRVYRVIKPS